MRLGVQGVRRSGDGDGSVPVGESGNSSKSRRVPGARVYDQSAERRDGPIRVLLQGDDRPLLFCVLHIRPTSP